MGTAFQQLGARPLRATSGRMSSRGAIIPLCAVPLVSHPPDHAPLTRQPVGAVACHARSLPLPQAATHPASPVAYVAVTKFCPTTSRLCVQQGLNVALTGCTNGCGTPLLAEPKQAGPATLRPAVATAHPGGVKAIHDHVSSFPTSHILNRCGST